MLILLEIIMFCLFVSNGYSTALADMKNVYQAH